ncbi:MAG: hypothetical protein IAE89_04720 [Anaerolineae bacterium]|nr:hypothetical protein [Anaerolineae bacterium]
MGILFLKICAALTLSVFTLSVVQGQSSTLQPYVPAQGSIAGGGTDQWSFPAVAGEVISIAVQPGGTLDPIITLMNSSGERIIGNDDAAYPEITASVLQAITIPRTDTYTVTVAGYGSSSGAYAILLTNGFAEVIKSDDFNTRGRWAAIGEETTLTVENGQLELQVGGTLARGGAVEESSNLADFAARIEVVSVTNGAGWLVGIIARRQGENYYLYEVNSQGRWRFSLIQDGTRTVLSDWREHPAIRSGEAQFSLMLMAKGGGFDFFYNNAFVGSVSDLTLNGPGAIGLAAGTISNSASLTTAVFDTLRVTQPILLNGAPIIPQEITLGDAATMSQAVVRRHVAGANGVMVLTVPEATVSLTRPGFDYLLLGQGTSFGNFAMGATVNIQSSVEAEVGCGLMFHYQDNSNFTLAFLDETGGFGISRRIEDTFEPDLFGENPAWAGRGRHHLLIISDDDKLYYYVDGISAGSLDIPSQAGQVGAAAINYVSMDTTCTFSNLWLWEWDR